MRIIKAAEKLLATEEGKTFAQLAGAGAEGDITAVERFAREALEALGIPTNGGDGAIAGAASRSAASSNQLMALDAEEVRHRVGNPLFAIETNLGPLARRIKDGRTGEALEIVGDVETSVNKAKLALSNLDNSARDAALRLAAVGDRPTR
jgi:hypothetical protein